jgi:hypothetical protein
VQAGERRGGFVARDKRKRMSVSWRRLGKKKAIDGVKIQSQQGFLRADDRNEMGKGRYIRKDQPRSCAPASRLEARQSEFDPRDGRGATEEIREG